MGDDLRQDMLTMQLVNIMDKLWLQSGLDLKMVTFDTLATSNKKGKTHRGNIWSFSDSMHWKTFRISTFLTFAIERDISTIISAFSLMWFNLCQFYDTFFYLLVYGG